MKKNLSILGMVLFGLGLLLGVWYYGSAAWGDFEAYFFDPDNRGDTALRTLSCPVLIAPGQTETVTVTLHNPTDSTVKPILKAHISAGFITAMSQDNQVLSLGPGETLQLHWNVTADEAAWGRFVMVKVSSLAYPIPSQVGSCGVVVVNFLGMPGGTVAILATVLSLALALAGLFVWVAANRPLILARPLSMRAAMLVLLLLLALGLASSFLGWWVLGGLCAGLSILLAVVAGGYFAISA